jgi:L-threonylcarbamoyladenylate synthase
LKTEIIKLDVNRLDLDKLDHAAEVLRNGGLVAFPTETVYGLGANALDEKAVAGIFKAKGRPSDNPLIVHISRISDVDKLVSFIPPKAHKLMEAFWPGPLTLIMPKSDSVNHIITAGLETVAIRMPSHPIATALIQKAGVAVAAPSANSSGKPSPTCAEHVIDDLFGKVDVIIDGGKVEVGLESTVLDIISEPPVILRPGGVTPGQLQQLLGTVNLDPSLLTGNTGSFIPKSPGMKYRHYAPKASIIIIEGGLDRVVDEINRLSEQYEMQGIKTGILATDETFKRYHTGEVVSLGSRKKPITIASNLFYSLRHFDGKDIGMILAEAVEGEGIGLAVMNRLNKAAGYNIIKV